MLITPFVCDVFYLGPPGAPRGLEVEDVTTRSCVLKWKAPEFDGGSPVSGYYVESSQRSYSTRWSKVNRTAVRQPRLEIKDLIELTEYIFRVTAENVVGLGEPAELKDSVIPKSQFGQLASTLLNIFISHQRNSYRYKRYLPNLSDNPLCPETL